MKKSEALLHPGMGGFILWLLIAVVHPWAGFAFRGSSLPDNCRLVFFMFACFLMSTRA